MSQSAADPTLTLDRSRHAVARGWTIVVVLLGIVALGSAPGGAVSAESAVAVYRPVADTFVEASSPAKASGSATRLVSDQEPHREAYLRFSVSGVSGTVERAMLRLRVYDGTSDGPRLHTTGTGWAEASTTWESRPALTSGVIEDKGSVAAETWLEFDVTSVVRGNGDFGFALLPTSRNGLYVYSKEGTSPPELILSTGSGSTPPDPTPPADSQPPTSPNVSLGNAGTNSIGLSWAASTDNIGVVRYDVYTGDTKVGSTSGTSYTVTGLACGTTYTLGVAAVDAAGNASSRAGVTATTAACSSPPPPPPSSSLTLPLRGAFYYPWYPETWTVGGVHVAYHPALGYYDSSVAGVVDEHVRQLGRAKVDVGIASWWGSGTHSETSRIPLLLDRTAALGSSLRWTVYYEKEGSGNPSVAEIRADLDYLLSRYAGRPEWARVGGKPVIFVWAAGDTTCEVADRWAQASAGQWYVSLKVFSGYRNCVSQPAAWHQYAGSTPSDRQAGFSFTVSPGFWRADEPAPRLARDPARFAQNVRDMVAAGDPWQLIVSFNEWGEGTAVEPAAEWGSQYVDLLATNGGSAPPPPPPPPPSADTVTLAAVGDLGGNSRSAATLEAIRLSGASFGVLLGDASYDEITPESAWCSWVKNRLPMGLELVAGNHEEDSRVDGYIRNFAACMPSRMGAVGDYGTEYVIDTGPLRMIMISPTLTVDGVRYDYTATAARSAWLRERIREAKAAGKQVVVGMHKVCLSAGNKSCEIGDFLVDLLIAEGVDLVLQGHDHDYQRMVQFRCANPGIYEPACVADDGSDGVYSGSGTVFVITGSGGRSLTTINTADPEYPYVTRWLGGQSPNTGQGFLKLVVTATEIRGEFLGSTTTFTDTFTIR